MADIMPASNYNKLSENLRRVTPNSIQCSIFCGGRRCKYENPDNLDAVHMAVDGLFSHWVTDDILATARPSTELINNKNLIDQFKRYSIQLENQGIKSLINLQLPGEHASCGPPLEPSGFTYCPGAFMENNIYFYNFGWRDYGEAKIHRLLDMVKVMAFALEEGKVAVHCHAGLGRTGVLIACYLVFSLRVRANEAIRYVRLKRPNSVQTRGQILCVQEFDQFVLPQSTVFCNKDLAKDRKVQDFSLKQFLTRQAVTAHGYEARLLKYIPKIVFVICERLLQLCHCQHVACLHKGTKHFIVYHINPDSRIKFSHSGSASTESADSSLRSMFASTTSTMTEFDHDISQCTSPDMPSCSSGMSGLDDNCLETILEDEIHADDLHKNTCFQELSSTTDLKRISQEENIIHIEAEEVARALCSDHQVVDEDTTKCIRNFKLDLSNKASAWARLRIERNVHVMSALLYDWLEHLRTPILEQEDLSYIVIYGNKPEECLQKLDRATKYTIEYILRFISHLRPLEHEVHINMMRRFVASLTHQTVLVNDVLQPSGKGFNKLRGGTLKAVMKFLQTFFDMIKDTAETPEKNSPAGNNKEIISLDIDEV